MARQRKQKCSVTQASLTQASVTQASVTQGSRYGRWPQVCSDRGHPGALARALLAVLGLIVPCIAARAQTTVDPRMERDTVGSRARPEVEASGIAVGGLLVSPSFGIEADATDNLYARGDAKRSTAGYALQLALAVRSQWSRHALGLTADGVIKRYTAVTSENNETGGIKLDGRLDLAADTRLSGDVGIAHRLEPRGTTGDTLFGAAPISFTAFSGGAEFEQRFAQFRVNLGGRYESFRYSDRTFGGTVFDLSARDFEALTGTLRAAIGVGPGVAAFASFSVNRNRYTAPPVGPSRDSEGFIALGGVAFGLNRLLQGEIGLGYIRQEFTAPVFPRISGLAYNGQLKWSPTRLTTVRAVVGRTFQRSPLIGIAGIQQHEVSLSAEHELLRALILRPAVRYMVADYRTPDRAATRLVERYVIASFGAGWRLTPHLEMSAEFAHSLARNNNPASMGRVFNRNRVAVSLRWRL